MEELINLCVIVVIERKFDSLRILFLTKQILPWFNAHTPNSSKVFVPLKKKPPSSVFGVQFRWRKRKHNCDRNELL